MCKVNEAIEPVLAMYDVREKQDFIFRTNKLKEIVGGSWVIRDCFEDYLYPVAEEYSSEYFGQVGSLESSDCSKGTGRGIFSYKKCDRKEMFSEEEFMVHMKEGYIGELVYDGGGNFILIYRNVGVYKEVTYRFTRVLKECIGTLHVIGTYIPDINFLNYPGDRNRLYDKHRITEGTHMRDQTAYGLPVTQMDRKTIQPLVHKKMLDDDRCLMKMMKRRYGDAIYKKVKSNIEQWGKYTKEQFAKRLKYTSEIYRIQKSHAGIDLTPTEKDFYKNNEKILDNIIEKKGEDSQIAVVYIDGNSMGAKVQECIRDKKEYSNCVPKLRKFSEDIQKLYVEEGIEHAFEGMDRFSGYRIVVSAGDEINFIVKAKDAFGCAVNYLNALRRHNEETGDNASACAGIAVFHSHFSYADAYAIAEECCETGKKLMKKREIDCASFVDFHICQGAVGTSLEDIREHENGEIISRPWMLWNKEDGKDGKSGPMITYYADVERMSAFLNKMGRSNVKGMAEAAKESSAKLMLELRRIWAHCRREIREECTEEWEWISNMDDTVRRKMIYDIVMGYDLWFAKEDDK